MNSRNPTFFPASRQFLIHNGVSINYSQKYCKNGHDFELHPRNHCHSCIESKLANRGLRRQNQPMPRRQNQRINVSQLPNQSNQMSQPSSSTSISVPLSSTSSTSRHLSSRVPDPVSTSIHFPHLPFFNVQKDLFGPQFIDQGRPNTEFNFMTINLKLPSGYVDAIKTETHDVQLRIFHERNDGKPTISYPSYFEILFDDQMIGLNGKLNSNVKKAVLTEPIMLGSRMKHSPDRTHRLTCRWKYYSAAEYKISIVIVRVLSVNDLYDNVMKKPRLAYDQTRKMVLKMFGEDDDLRMDIVRESLTCPCDTRRIATAARSATCNHLKCFDLKNMIMLNQKRPIWKCPVCNQEATYSSLIIDSYFTDVINAMKGNPINEIEFLKTGKWKPFAPKSDNTILLEDSDEDDSVSSNVASNSPNNQASNSPNNRISSVVNRTSNNLSTNGVHDVVTLDDSTESISPPNPKSQPIVHKSHEVNSAADPRLQNGRIDSFLRKQEQPSTSNIQYRPQTQPHIIDVITLSDSSDDDDEPTHLYTTLAQPSSVQSSSIQPSSPSIESSPSTPIEVQTQIEVPPRSSIRFPTHSILSSVLLPTSLRLKISMNSTKEESNDEEEEGVPTREQCDEMISSICANSNSPSIAQSITPIISPSISDEQVIRESSIETSSTSIPQLISVNVPEESTAASSSNDSTEFSLPAATITTRGCNRRKSQPSRTESPPLKIKSISTYDESGEMTSVVQTDEPKQRQKRKLGARSKPSQTGSPQLKSKHVDTPNKSIETTTVIQADNPKRGRRKAAHPSQPESPQLKVIHTNTCDESIEMITMTPNGKPKSKEKRKRVVPPNNENVRVTRSASLKAKAKK